MKIIAILIYLQCESVLEIDPKNVKAFYRRGQCHYAMGESDLALTDFHRVNPFYIPLNEQNQIIKTTKQLKAI